MNQLTTRSTGIFAVMAAVLILTFAAAMNVSAQAGPDRPTDLTATAVDHDTVSLNWSHPNPASVDHYQVLSRRADSGTGISQVGTSTTTSFLHDGLDPESTYIYRVRPVNSQGEEGQRSSRAEATTPADETPAPEPEPTPAPPQRSDDEGQDNTARSSHDVLVSNTGQTWIGNPSPDDRAQAFTTGTNSAGYVLTSVVIGYNDADDDEFTASIWTTDASGAPSALKYSLTAPTFSPGDLTFTAPADAALDANTTYTVVSEIPALQITFKRTSTINPNEDPGAATGWSIADTYHFKNFAGWTPSSSNRPMLIAVHGTINPGGTTDSDDATLSDLELEDNSGTAITLTPTFASGTTTYTANVVNSVDEITVTPTVNESNATYEIQDNSGTALTDADTNTTGFQVDLSEGENTIKVEVTAQDASTETYTVTVTRAAAATPTVSISANKTSAVFKEDGITYTLTRSGATTAALPVMVTLTQTKDFLATADLSQTVTIAAGQSTGTFTVAASSFEHFAAGALVEGGTLTAAVQDGADYDLGSPSSVDVSIVIGVTVRFEQASYTIGEAGGTLSVKLIGRTGAGAPQPTSMTGNIVLSSNNGSAINFTDFHFFTTTFAWGTGAFIADGGRWKAEHSLDITITNDALDENSETFNLKVQRHASTLAYSLVDANGNSCGSVCTVTVTITDDDTAGVTISKSSLTVTEQDATGDSYTVVLDTQPTADVVVTVAGYSGTDLTLTPTRPR